jgi:hypothetical protein
MPSHKPGLFSIDAVDIFYQLVPFELVIFAFSKLLTSYHATTIYCKSVLMNECSIIVLDFIASPASSPSCASHFESFQI